VRRWGKVWYDIHDPWNFDLTSSGKVLFPDVANSNRFTFDPGGLLPLHSAYYILPRIVDGEFLAAILNSKVFEFLIRLFAPVVKDGFSRYRKQFLRTLPIPELSSSERKKIVRAARDGATETVEDLVAKGFSLSLRESDLVSRWVLERRAASGL